MKEAIRRHGHKAKDMLIDLRRHDSMRLVEMAGKYYMLIILKDLGKLRSGYNGSRRVNSKVSLSAYRRRQYMR
jgi:hypothetical protein